MPEVEITNTARAMRGINATEGLVMLAPGETRPLDVPEAELVDVPEYFTVGKAAVAADAAEPAKGDDLSGKTVAELRAIAAERGVTLPETGSGGDGRVLKSDIIAALEAKPADALDDMTDAELRTAVQALTGDEAPADASRADLLAIARGV